MNDDPKTGYNKLLKKFSTPKDTNIKICSKCKKAYPATVEHFHRHKSGKYGLNSYCKECEKVRYKKLHIKKKYDIKFEEIQKMMKRQNSHCAICNRRLEDLMDGKNNLLYPRVDHDHETGEIRELLCLKCNVILGYAFDNDYILISAIKYLRKHRKR